MLREKEAVTRNIYILIDALVVSLAYFMAFFLRKVVDPHLVGQWFPGWSGLIVDPNLTVSQYIVFLVAVAPLWLWTLYGNGMYRPMRTLTYLQIFWTICKSAFMTFLAFGTILFIFKTSQISRLFFFLFGGFSFTLILIEKTGLYLVMHYVRRQGYNFRRLLIVGTGRRAAAFIQRIRNHPEWGFHILGVVDDEPGRGIEKVCGIDVVGTINDIPEFLHRDAIDEIVFVVPRSRLSHLEGALHDCETEGVVTTITVDLFDMEIAKSGVSEIDGIPLLRFNTTKINEWQLFIKRFIDIVISGLVIVLLGPLLLIIAMLIKLTSPGPVFFKQQRLGLHGRKFTLYKFRTMREGAHDVLSQVTDLNEMTTPEFRKKKTNWITPLGRLLRKFSLDELPQFFNVFIGHMSLIGPRPTVPDEVDKYETWQRRRFSMKPGITCLWQVNGRNKIGFEDWMKLDLEYLDNWSLWLDVKIMIKTIPVVLFGIGAY
jgi:exopolysaccharide biosynthesis polyprenyl glycosylphosphotransferase